MAPARVPDRDARCPVCGEPASRLRYVITRFRIYDCAQLRGSCTCGRRSTTARCASCSSASTPRARARCPSSRPTTTSPTPTRPTTRWCRPTSAGSTRSSASARPGGCSTSAAAPACSSPSRAGAAGSPTASTTARAATAHARDHFGLEVWDGQFTDFAAREGLRFDAISMWDVIEHARAPVALLAAARSVLAPGGVIGDLHAESAQHPRSRRGPALPRLGRPDHAAAREVLHRAALPLLQPRHAAQTRSTAPRSSSLRLERELTELRRLSLSRAERLLLEALFLAARLTGLENRLFAIARAR